MRISGIELLQSLKRKNRGNKLLIKAIDQLIRDLEEWDHKSIPLRVIRRDADCVNSNGFYFFNIHIHRTLVQIILEEEGEANIIWAGSHDDYVRIFKNNKDTILYWLRNNHFLE